MSQQPIPDRHFGKLGWLLIAIATLIAVLGAKSHAGGWNDGSRLASVEMLSERGSFVIDDSIFVKVPPIEAGRPSPYPLDRLDLHTLGTLDKLLIDKHFYSDKSPVLTLLMAVPHRLWLLAGGPTAAQRPDWFCYLQTVLSSGLAFVVAVACIWRLGIAIGLTRWWSLALPVALMFATVAPVYSQQVNSHIVLLGVTSALCLALAKCDRLSRAVGFTPTVYAPRGGKPHGSSELRLNCSRYSSALRYVTIGLLTGFGYTVDLGLGPILVLATLVYCVYQIRRITPLCFVILGMLPFVAIHHVLNYSIGGTIGPMNAVPEYLAWPGSPFTADIATGGFKHPLGWFFVYAAEMLFGNKGFLLHNLPLLLTPGGAWLLGRGSPATRPAVAFVLMFCGGGWLLYAAMSTNMSGMCCSVRWFVPFVAPGVWVVGLVLRDLPRYCPDFLWLTAWGTAMTTVMILAGPWTMRMVPGYWGWVAVGGIGWGVVRFWRRKV